MVAIMVWLLRLKWLTKENFPLAWWSTKRGEWIIVGERRLAEISETVQIRVRVGVGCISLPLRSIILLSCSTWNATSLPLGMTSIAIHISVESTRSYNSRRRLMICLTATIYSSWDWCRPSVKTTKLTCSDNLWLKMHLNWQFRDPGCLQVYPPKEYFYRFVYWWRPIWWGVRSIKICTVLKDIVHKTNKILRKDFLYACDPYDYFMYTTWTWSALFLVSARDFPANQKRTCRRLPWSANQTPTDAKLGDIEGIKKIPKKIPWHSRRECSHRHYVHSCYGHNQ